VQIYKLGFHAPDRIHEMHYPIQTKRSDENRKKRTKSWEKRIPINDGMAADCLAAKRHRNRYKADYGRKRGNVEIERASEVAAQHSLYRPTPAAKRTGQPSHPFEGACLQTQKSARRRQRQDSGATKQD
jgi:hypothetical protein